MRTLALASALIVALSSAGCAALAAKAPDPDRPVDQPPECNDGKGGVVVDGLMATALGLGTIAFAANGEGSGAAIFGLGALAYGISASAGSSSANKCRAANDDYVVMLERRDAESQAASAGIGGLPFADADEDTPLATVRPPVAVAPAVPTRTVAPPRPPTPTSVPPPAPAGDGTDDPSSAEVDADAWSDFWKEVPR